MALLGPGFVVESSVGHIRDLPRRADEVPAAYKGEGWARLGVDVDNGFKPLYVVAPEKKSVVARLKSLLKGASEVYLATDEDREGESIAWHLTEVLSPRVPVKRMVFHEITAGAIAARRRGLARARPPPGRCPGGPPHPRPALRLRGVPGLVEEGDAPPLGRPGPERGHPDDRRARTGPYAVPRRAAGGTSKATFVAAGTSFGANLVAVDGTPVATGRDFSETGELNKTDVVLLAESEATALAQGLTGQPFTVRSVTEKPYRRTPAAPFITSTLQQEASRKLRFGAQRTMQVAQRLYEQGWITYMRTDSTTLSDQALTAARAQAADLYGADFVADATAPLRAQGEERPGGARGHPPRRRELPHARSARRLSFRATRCGSTTSSGSAPWRRRWQTPPARAHSSGWPVRRSGTVPREAEFAAAGTVITFPGFLRAYVEGSDDAEAELAERDVRLPPLSEGDTVTDSTLEAKVHATQPPPRYTEASLVKALEELGVGRPSTYASILGTIQSRGYVWKKGTALVPSFTAFAVVGLLERYFADLVDYGFTAAMEDDLDEIANGTQEALPWLTRFYFGEGTIPGTPATTSEPPGVNGPPAVNGKANGKSAHGGEDRARRGLKEDVSSHLGEIDAREVNSIPIGTDTEGRPIVVRVGRYGPYLQRGEDERAGVPEDLPPDELTVEKAEELLLAPSADRTLGTDPQSGTEVLVRAGRFGPYVQLGEAVDGERPRTASLFRSMTPETVTLEQALELLQLPRLVGADPESGDEIQALNGRFGPYLKKGTDTRSLESEEQLFLVTLDEALVLFSQPKTRRGRGAAASPLRELGPDPDTGAPMVVRSGRFGPYVTDGTTNASLRKGDEPETITAERAVELLADRRAAGPSTGRRTAAKKTAKKATKATKTTAKKTAKKTTKKTAKKATGAKKAAAPVASTDG